MGSSAAQGRDIRIEVGTVELQAFVGYRLLQIQESVGSGSYVTRNFIKAKNRARGARHYFGMKALI